MNVNHRLKLFLALLIAISGIALPSAQADEHKTIVVYGASGRIGEVIVDVALERGYKVIGISRNPEKLQFTHRNFTARKGDLMDVSSIRELARGAYAIVISISAKANDNQPENSVLVNATKNVVEALSQLEKKPYIVQMGSASMMYGSTFAEIRLNLLDAPFPFEEGTVMHAVIVGHQISLRAYQQSSLDWSIVAPPMKILGIYKDRDKITTKPSYRTSTSAPLIDTEGNKTIYVRDLARATVDEIENRKFVRQFFNAAY